jgi:hypothetical protein
VARVGTAVGSRLPDGVSIFFTEALIWLANALKTLKLAKKLCKDNPELWKIEGGQNENVGDR